MPERQAAAARPGSRCSASRCALANDANCLALSEATDGAGAGAEVVFAVILGTGTGAGIAVHGRVLSGPNGLAGEWGHNPLPWAVPGEDPLFDCYCGQRGCIETLLSGPGLARDHRALWRRGASTAAQIAARAAAGDAACQATLQRYAARLARALAASSTCSTPMSSCSPAALSKIDSLYEQVPRLWGRWVVSGGLAGRGAHAAAAQPPRRRLGRARRGLAVARSGGATLRR